MAVVLRELSLGVKGCEVDAHPGHDIFSQRLDGVPVQPSPDRGFGGYFVRRAIERGTGCQVDAEGKRCLLQVAPPRMSQSLAALGVLLLGQEKPARATT